MSTQQLKLLRVLQLVSPSLPIGNYAYSQGLESAIEFGWVKDANTLQDWLSGLLCQSLAYNDIPILMRLYDAWKDDDIEAIEYWDRFMFSLRETRELQQEDVQLSLALRRLLKQLGMIDDHSSTANSFLASYAGCAYRWDIDKISAANAFLWTWAENQVMAAIKLMPVGQTDGQRLLFSLAEDIANVVNESLRVADEDIGYFSPGLGLLSTHHETQYSRLFRS